MTRNLRGVGLAATSYHAFQHGSRVIDIPAGTRNRIRRHAN
jgi:hypothetical protein